MPRASSIPSPHLLVPALIVLATGCFLDRSPRSGPNDRADGGPGRDAQVIRPDAGPPLDASPSLDAGPRPDGGDPRSDRDGDGIPDDLDLCPDVYDPDQQDLDGDGLGDACDDDRDGDGISNALDLCPDLDSRGPPDEDGDGIRDDCDVCPLDADPTQANADGDQLGDACEDPDPNRFSRVAYLATFSSLGDLTASPATNVTVMGGAAHVHSPGRTLLWHPEDSGFPSNYAVDVRATYRERVGDSATSGAVAALTRWAQPPGRGYALGVRTQDNAYGIVRLCPGTCPEELSGSAGLDLARDTAFGLRATAFGNTLTLDLTVAGGSGVRQATATDAEHPAGGFGVLVEGARAEIHAIAVYAP